MNETDRNIKKQSTSQIPVAEWIVAGIGLLLVVGSLAFLAYRSLSESSPPVFEAELIRVIRSKGGYLAEIRVHNRGSEAVASLRLSGRLRGAPAADCKQVVVDYLPGRSSRMLGLIFLDQPDKDNLMIHFESYAVP